MKKPVISRITSADDPGVPTQTACRLPLLSATVMPLAVLFPLNTLSVEVLGELLMVGPKDT